MRVYVNRYGNLCDIDSFYSNVYTNYENAFEEGIQELNDRIIKLKNADANYFDEKTETFIKEMIYYKFVIHERIVMDEFDKLISKMIKMSFKTKVEVTKDTDMYELCRNHSSSIDYEFDYKGNLIERWEYRGAGYLRMPSDYEEDAGVRFAVGDVVRVENNPFGENYCVVMSVPGRLRDAKNVFRWENIYSLEFAFIEDGKILKMDEIFFEHHIEKVEDESICNQVKKLISEAEYKY